VYVDMYNKYLLNFWIS